MPGEAWLCHRCKLADLQALEADGLFRICRNYDEVHAAKAARHIGMIFATEDADFLDQDLSPLQQVLDDRVRMLTLVHFHNNTLGDILTSEAGNHGTTRFSRNSWRQ